MSTVDDAPTAGSVAYVRVVADVLQEHRRCLGGDSPLVATGDTVTVLVQDAIRLVSLGPRRLTEAMPTDTMWP